MRSRYAPRRANGLLLDGVFILAAPLVLALIAYRVTKGLCVTRAALSAVLAIYALWAADLLFFPLLIDPSLRTQAAIEAGHYARWVNLVPFATVHDQLTASTGIAYRQLGGNLGLLLPLGLIGPVLVRRLRRWRVALGVALACSVGIELLQLLGTLLGLIRRSVDVDDVIVNVAGAALGFAVWKMISTMTRRPESSDTAEPDPA